MECKVGLATRPVRVVILSIGLVFARARRSGFRTARAGRVRARGADVFTAIQRIVYVRKQLATAPQL